MKTLLLVGILFSNAGMAEYFEAAREGGSLEHSQCIRVENGTAQDAIQKIKTQFKACKERETLVKDSFSVLCKSPENTPQSQVHFFSKTERSCRALIEFQKTKKIPGDLDLRKKRAG